MGRFQELGRRRTVVNVSKAVEHIALAATLLEECGWTNWSNWLNDEVESLITNLGVPERGKGGDTFESTKRDGGERAEEAIPKATS